MTHRKLLLQSAAGFTESPYELAAPSASRSSDGRDPTAWAARRAAWPQAPQTGTFVPGKARRFFRRTWTVLPAVLALAAPARAQGQRAPQPPPPPPLENRRELGLSAAQNRALRQLEKTSDATANHLHRRLDGLRAELDRSYRVYALNAARIAALHRQIQGTQADLLRTRLDTQKRLRGILTAHQFRALQTLLPPPPPEPPQPPRPPMPPYAPPPPPPPYAPRPPHAPRAPRPAPAPRPR